jgi:hypothetical protein
MNGSSVRRQFPTNWQIQSTELEKGIYPVGNLTQTSSLPRTSYDGSSSRLWNSGVEQSYTLDTLRISVYSLTSVWLWHGPWQCPPQIMHSCWGMHVRAHRSYKGYTLLQFPCIVHSCQDYLELHITKVRTFFVLSSTPNDIMLSKDFWKKRSLRSRDDERNRPEVTLRESVYPIALVTILFFLWGFSYSLLDTLNKHFQNTLNITKARSSGLQAAYFGFVNTSVSLTISQSWQSFSAYPLASLGHAAWILRHYGYRAVFIWGLFLYGSSTDPIPSLAIFNFF